MQSEVPKFLKTALVGDDVHLLASISAALGRRRAYLPVLSGPRIQRPDLEHEVIRRNNALALVQPDRILFAGLPEATCALFAGRLPMAERVASIEEVLPDKPISRPRPTLVSGRKRVGLGLLRALRGRRLLEFDGSDTPGDGVAMDSAHVVLCEEGDDHAQVIAANYAYSIDAGLGLIPSFPPDEAEMLLEKLYGFGDASVVPTTFLTEFAARLRAHCGGLRLPPKAVVTFVTGRLPWGIAFPEFPSTHLFRYPDLGIALIKGIAAEQPDSPGITTALVVDPGSVKSTEVVTALERLTQSGAISKALRSRAATVHQVSNNIVLYPYDLLLVSTHCGDASGWRWTYQYLDSESRPRELVVDVAAGFAFRPNDDEVGVTQFVKFVSLDGVDWTDREAKKNLYVGTAIHDYVRRTRDDSLAPVKRENIPRVRASMALRMADGDYIAMPESVASQRSPIVINNACASWHRLADTFMFGGARCYVGTLFSVLDVEAQAVLEHLFGKYYDRELAIGLWRTQNAVYGKTGRRPYVLCGCHFQRLTTRVPGTLGQIAGDLEKAYRDWRRMLRRSTMSGDPNVKTVAVMVDFLRSELSALRTHILRSRRRRTD